MKIYLLLIAACVALSCVPSNDPVRPPLKTEPVVEQEINLPDYETELPLTAGYRYSSYGAQHLNVKESTYWTSVGKEMARKFDGSAPSSIWILGTLQGDGIYLNFPAETNHTLIKTASADFNEAIFDEFDNNGFKIWLQIEPGNAPVEELIKVILEKYKHHSCIIGFGVDVEWYQSVDKPDGVAISDKQAKQWLSLIRSYNPEYRLFLKHWLKEKMPPTFREGLVFIDDSQGVSSKQVLLDEFKEWGEYFSGGQVGFQYGYDSDRAWWGGMNDPAKEFGQALKDEIPNTIGLYWVDFTLETVLKP